MPVIICLRRSPSRSRPCHARRPSLCHPSTMSQGFCHLPSFPLRHRTARRHHAAIHGPLVPSHPSPFRNAQSVPHSHMGYHPSVSLFVLVRHSSNIHYPRTTRTQLPISISERIPQCRNHFNGPVTYSSEGFLVRNLDALNPDFVSLLPWSCGHSV